MSKSKYDKTWPARKVEWWAKTEDGQMCNSDISVRLAMAEQRVKLTGNSQGHNMEAEYAPRKQEVALYCSECRKSGILSITAEDAVTSERLEVFSLPCQISNSGRSRIENTALEVMAVGRSYGHLFFELSSTDYMPRGSIRLTCNQCGHQVEIMPYTERTSRMGFPDDIKHAYRFSSYFFEKPCPLAGPYLP